MITIQPTYSSPAPSNLELYVCPFTVLESSAEQQPWTFDGIVIAGQQWIIKRKRQYMRTADYSIEGHENAILIERKNPDDLVGSVLGGHKRLEAEHERMAEVVRAGGFACLVCEGDYGAIDDRLRLEGRDRAADTLQGCYASWPMRFGTPWFFCGTRRHAEIVAFRILWKAWRKLNETH